MKTKLKAVPTDSVTSDERLTRGPFLTAMGYIDELTADAIEQFFEEHSELGGKPSHQQQFVFRLMRLHFTRTIVRDALRAIDEKSRGEK